MAVTLPPSLVKYLSVLGLDWPDSDEDQLEAMGDAWQAFGHELDTIIADIDKHAHAVWSDNQGEAIVAFQNSWTGSDAPIASLRDGSAAAAMIAEGLYLAAKIVIALKLKFVAELTALAIGTARAIAAAVATRGASLLVIPLLRYLAKRAIEEAIAYAIGELLS